MNLSLDLGTRYAHIRAASARIVRNEPSVVAVQDEPTRRQDHLVAVGVEAKNSWGGPRGHITAVRPMKDCVIADFTYTE